MLASGIKNQRSGQDGLTHPIKTGTFQSSETPKKSNVKEISNVPVNFSSSLQQSELYSYGVGNRANKPDLVNLSKLVIKKIRCLFGFKSSNKHYGNNDNVISPDKLPFYSQRERQVRDSRQRTVLDNISRDELYNNSYKYTGNPETFFHYGRLLIENSKIASANCDRQSPIAYFFLNYTFKYYATEFFIDIVSLKNSKFTPGFSHCVIIIRDAVYKEEAYPDNMHKCYPNDFIIDPWANIGCSAHHYPEQWNKKMDKWAARKLIIDKGTSPKELKGLVEDCQIKSYLTIKGDAKKNATGNEFDKYMEESTLAAYGNFWKEWTTNDG